MGTRKPRARRVSKERLGQEAESQLRSNIKPTLEKFWSTVKTKLDAGDARTMEMIARMVQYDRGPGGVTIFNQNLQMNSSLQVDATARVRSFDQIIGKLEEQEKFALQNRMMTAAALENSEPDEDDDEDDDEEQEDANPPETFDAQAELVTQE